MRSLLFCIIILTSVLTATAQVRLHIAAMAARLGASGRYVGQYGAMPGNGVHEKWLLFDSLKNAATRNELVALTDHEIPVVRCYAIKGLVARRYKPIKEIVLSHLADNAVVRGSDGCEVISTTVGDFFYREYIMQNKSRIPDSMLLHAKGSRLHARISITARLPQTDANYRLIRDIITEEKFSGPLPHLMAYGHAEDTTLVLQLLQYGSEQEKIDALFAAKKYPLAAYIPHIKQLATVSTRSPDPANSYAILIEDMASHVLEDDFYMDK